MPIRATLSPYAGPMPRPVVPIRAEPRYRSTTRSSARWCGMIRCASPEMRRRETSTPRSARPSISAQQHLRVDHDPVADDDDRAGGERAGRHQVQRVLLTVRGDHRVAGVVAAGVPHDVVDPASEQVGHLALAFIAPLGADDARSLACLRLPRERLAPRNVRLTRTTPGSCAERANTRSRRMPYVPSVVILTLSDPSSRPGGGCDGCACASEAPRVPVLACADALRGGGGTRRARHGLRGRRDRRRGQAGRAPARRGWSSRRPPTREVRAVVRRMVRILAPPPSKRPADLPAGRTVFDLPPLGGAAAHPGHARPGRVPSACPPTPAAVAAAVARRRAAALRPAAQRRAAR